MRVKNVLLGFCLSMVPLAGIADKGDVYAGGGVMFGQYKFNEPDFSTDTTSVVSPVIYGGWALSALSTVEIGYRKFEEDAGDSSPNSFGVTSELQQIYLEYARKLRLSRSFKPWVHAGVIVNSISSSSAFSTDEDGFLDDVYPFREDTELSAYIGGKLVVDLTGSLSLIPSVNYEFAIGDVPEGLTGGISLRYTFAQDD